MIERVNGWSQLGFGCLRFPKKGNGFDMEEIAREICYAIEQGVNYFDTAFTYRGSEKALGDVLAQYGLRDRIQIASKMPHYHIHSLDELEKNFAEQLRRLQTDHIDNYLMHFLPDVTTWETLVSLGVPEWLREKQSAGAIGRVGFSYHGNTENFRKLLDAWDWEFCQVQYNYMDEHSQAGRKGVAYAAEKGIPVIIMEPLRGGRLVNNLPKRAEELFAKHEPTRSPAEWGLRWLWDQPEVAVILSGMNSMDMVQENIRIANEAKPGELTENDRQLFADVRDAINEKIKVPCTGCGYCQPCPHGVDIPGTFRCYNELYTDGFARGVRDYLFCTTFRADRTNASRCKKCGACEQHCPQHIAIRQELSNASRHLENPIYKIVAAGSRGMFGKRKNKEKTKEIEQKRERQKENNQ